MTPDTLAHTHAAAFANARPWSSDEFRDLLSDRFTFLVGDAQCFALGRVIVGEAELLTLATHPKVQRQGLARERMSRWLSRAIDLGGNTAFLEVGADNFAAVQLYDAFGFAQVGCRRGYYPRESGPAVDALVLSRPLP
ncbi:GNAT family N-acetyltransferase [Aliisedimentitalea scapharcae]|uniref:GNAT family N-acetyltransferase n=1 Tax=Aliisedimentitalea scapharcae TaxID=1524259 RepID=A0ABZ2XVJ4_9RHOB